MATEFTGTKAEYHVSAAIQMAGRLDGNVFGRKWTRALLLLAVYNKLIKHSGRVP
jgi:hypothetical protein